MQVQNAAAWDFRDRGEATAAFETAKRSGLIGDGVAFKWVPADGAATDGHGRLSVAGNDLAPENVPAFAEAMRRGGGSHPGTPHEMKAHGAAPRRFRATPRPPPRHTHHHHHRPSSALGP